MADKAHIWTDKEIAKIQRHIVRFYAVAAKEVSKALSEYAEKIKTKADKLLQDIKDAKDETALKAAKMAYKRFYISEVLTSKEYQKTAQRAAQSLYEANTKAAEYINKKTAKIYAENYNAEGRKLGKDIRGYEFKPVSERDAGLYADITRQTIDKGKDKKWNVQNLKKSVVAGALANYAVDKIIDNAVRVTVQKNRNSANRQASDMAADAESLGRLDSFSRVEDEGFQIKKKWVATLDNRTRESHADLDGVVIDLDDEFLDGLSRPRDPNGAPEEIYNCRCTLAYEAGQKASETRAERVGTVTGSYKRSSSFTDTETGKVSNMTYKEWQKWRK